MGGFGLNISKGSTPYTKIPDNSIDVVSITLCGAVFLIEEFFITQLQFVTWLNNVFVSTNELGGVFYINQYDDLMYTNPEDFCDGSIDLNDLENLVFTTELSSGNEDVEEFIPIEAESSGNYFIAENV